VRRHGRGIVLALLGGVVTASGAVAQGADTGFVHGEYVSGEGRRAYRLFLPAGRGEHPPLVVLLHGCAQDPDDLALGTRFNEHAAEAGALVLYPEQPVDANPKRCWNWFDPAHQSRGSGEPALLAGMAREIAVRHGVDQTRTFVAGLSAGGAMAVVLGIAYPDVFAAIGSHSGVGWRVARDLPSGLAAMQGGRTETDSLARSARDAMGSRARFVPLIALHGTADSIVRPTATEQMVAQFVALSNLLRPGEASLSADSSRAESGGYPYTLRRYRDAHGKAVVEEWLVGGLGHAWSGGSPQRRWADPRGPDAAREMLRFFLEHPRGD
jgi:poly(hydroxyalkanoate) depolymerase family esterase